MKHSRYWNDPVDVLKLATLFCERAIPKSQIYDPISRITFYTNFTRCGSFYMHIWKIKIVSFKPFLWYFDILYSTPDENGSRERFGFQTDETLINKKYANVFIFSSWTLNLKAKFEIRVLYLIYKDSIFASTTRASSPSSLSKWSVS